MLILFFLPKSLAVLVLFCLISSYWIPSNEMGFLEFHIGQVFTIYSCFIIAVSGLLSSNEETQEYVVTGVGLLAGSSILLLTVLWGICLICAQKTYVEADSRVNNNLLQLLTGLLSLRLLRIVITIEFLIYYYRPIVLKLWFM